MALRKYKSLLSTTLSSGIGTGTGETITLASVTGIPTTTEVTLTIDRVDSSGTATPSKMERITGTISGSNLTSYVRGVDGSTEQAHSAGAVVEMVWNAEDWNDLIDWTLVSHNQSGYLSGSAVVASNISASAIVAGALAASAVTAGRISSSAVTSGTLAASAVVSGNLAASAVVRGNISSSAVTIGSIGFAHTVEIMVVDPATNTATGDGKAFFRIPDELNGMNLVGVAASVYTAGTTNTTDVQIRNITQTADMLSTKITIDSGETDTSTAAAAAVIDAANDDVATGDRIAIDVDAVSTTPAKGLVVMMRFALP